MADKSVIFFLQIEPSVETKKQYYSNELVPVMEDLNARFSLIPWNRDIIHNEIKNVATEYNLKLPKIAMPLRVMVTGDNSDTFYRFSSGITWPKRGT